MGYHHPNIHEVAKDVKVPTKKPTKCHELLADVKVRLPAWLELLVATS